MELTGPDFKLRNWQTEDAEALQKYADNPNVVAFLHDRFPHPYTLEDAVIYIESKQHQQPLLTFAIEVNGEAVGAVGLEFREAMYRKTPLLGYWLGEPFWGRGLMPEIVKTITAYAFGTFDIICIQATVLSGNPKSMRVLEKAGYEKQGILRQSTFKNDQIWDEHVYAILKP